MCYTDAFITTLQLLGLPPVPPSLSLHNVFTDCPVLHVVTFPIAACHCLVLDALSLAFYSQDNPPFSGSPF